MKRFNFPLDVKASVKLLAELKVHKCTLYIEYVHYKELLRIWKFCFLNTLSDCIALSAVALLGRETVVTKLHIFQRPTL